MGYITWQNNKMKKTFLVIAIMLLGFAATAQTNDTQEENSGDLVLVAEAQDPSRSQILTPTIEVTVGPRFAVVQKDYRDDVKQRFMYQAGVLFGVDMRQKHGATFLKTGLLLDDYHFTEYEWLSANLSFLDFPVNIGYLYRINNNFSLAGSVGVNFVYCYHYKDNFGLNVNGKEVIRNMIFGASVNVSTEYSFSKHFSVFANVSANFFFNRTMYVIFTHEYDHETPLYPMHPTHTTKYIEIPSFINIGVGVRYHLVWSKK